MEKVNSSEKRTFDFKKKLNEIFNEMNYYIENNNITLFIKVCLKIKQRIWTLKILYLIKNI